jgi:ABC-2 type transport system permease protein
VIARSASVALAIATRAERRLVKNPAPLLPPLLIPLFMFIAFTGALGSVGNSPGFGYYDYTAFEFVFVLYVSAIFSGVFSGFDIANDYESGIGARLMLAAPRRLAIVGGYLIYGLARGVLAVAFIWAIAVATRMPVRGDAIEITGLIALALLLNVATTLYAAGIALRFQTVASGSLIFIPIFMLLFLTPLFSTRDKLSGWLQTAADVNPLTPPLEAGRGLLGADPTRVVTSFAVVAGLLAATAIWAVLGMRRAEQGPRARRRRGPPGRRSN